MIQAIADMFGRISIEQVQADSMNGAKCLKERRIDQKAIPEDIRSRLTGAQLVTLGRLKGFGWSLEFVRKPLYQDQIVVLVDPSGEQHAVLHKDGSLDTSLDFMIR